MQFKQEYCKPTLLAVFFIITAAAISSSSFLAFFSIRFTMSEKLCGVTFCAAVPLFMQKHRITLLSAAPRQSRVQ